LANFSATSRIRRVIESKKGGRKRSRSFRPGQGKQDQTGKKMGRQDKEVDEKFYNQTGTDILYSLVWGKNIHFGIYETADEPMETATVRTKRRMAEPLGLSPDHTVLEVACGYGTTACFLANEYGCRVVATNYARRQLAAAKQLTEEAGQGDRVTFEWADYHDLHFADDSFDAWWCQEAITHAQDKSAVFREAHRVVRPGGKIAMSDQIINAATLSKKDRDVIAGRHGSDDLWGAENYIRALQDSGFRNVEFHDWSNQLATHFAAVCSRLEARMDEISKLVAPEVLTHNHEIWRFWVDAGRADKIGWGFFVAEK
jgi:sarcosine/dimethylglycine N-methyltransferase